MDNQGSRRQSRSYSESGHKKTIVFKLGSASLFSADERKINVKLVVDLIECMCELKNKGCNVLLVTSGAVAVGCMKLGRERPKELVTKQAIAAVGQSYLMRIYDDLFGYYKQPIAQVLLSRENLGKNTHYTNALNTFNELFRLGIIPIVNENDTVAVEELRVGDNDTLSALVASLVQAEYLFLLTDVSALYTSDPIKDPNAVPVRVVTSFEELASKCNIGDGGKWGTGGMATKISAAKLNSIAGVTTVICKSDEIFNVKKILEGDRTVGTVFLPVVDGLSKKKRWLAHGLQPDGMITVDDGAVRALQRKKSLFAAGIVKVEGDFLSMSNVQICSTDGHEIARGLVNYSSDQILKIMGQNSDDFHKILSYTGPDEIIHRDNMARTLARKTSVET